MNLQPAQTVEQIKRRYNAYLRAKGDQSEHANALRAAIGQGERDVRTLAQHLGNDDPRRAVYRELLFELELARGTLKAGDSLHHYR